MYRAPTKAKKEAFGMACAGRDFIPQNSRDAEEVSPPESGGIRNDSNETEGRKEKGLSPKTEAFCNLIPAATYVPTQLPVQYHRPGEA